VPGFQSNTTRSICVLCAMIEPPPGIGKNNNRDDTNNDSMTDGWIHLLIAKVFHLHRPRSAAVWNTFPRPSGCQHNVLFASQSRKFCFPLPKLASPSGFESLCHPATARDNCGAHHAPGTFNGRIRECCNAAAAVHSKQILTVLY